MKTKTSLTLAAALLLAGCSTLTSPELIEFMAQRAGDAARIALTSHLQTHQMHRPACEAAVIALDALMRSTNYTSSQLTAALAALPIREFHGTQGALILGGTVLVFDLVTMWAYDVQSTPAVASLARAIRNGIQAALDASPTARGIEPVPQPPRKLVPVKVIKV